MPPFAISRTHLVNSANCNQILELSRVLWSWEICENCQKQERCTDNKCPGTTIDRLRPYLLYCSSIISPVPSETSSVILPPTSDDHFFLIKALREDPTITRKDLREMCESRSSPGIQSQSEQDDAINGAIKLLIMTDCSPIDHWADRLETGTLRKPWKEGVAFDRFVEDMLPAMESHQALSFPDSPEYDDFKIQIKATRLVKNLNISFRGTSDIRNHLLFDRQRREIQIFHFTGFLKEQLRLTKNHARDLPVKDTLRLWVFAYN